MGLLLVLDDTGSTVASSDRLHVEWIYVHAAGDEKTVWTTLWATDVDPSRPDAFVSILSLLDLFLAWNALRGQPITQNRRNSAMFDRVSIYGPAQAVYKLFEGGDRDRHKPYLESRTVQQWLGPALAFEGTHCVVLRYALHPGRSWAKNPGEFIPVVKQLAALHDEGYCHGDLRGTNILFDGENSRIIDYDYAGKPGEGATYPHGLAESLSDLGGRPAGMYSGQPMLTEHDWESLAQVMRLHQIVGSQQQASRSASSWTRAIEAAGIIKAGEKDKVDKLISLLTVCADRALDVGSEYPQRE